jgi:DNA-binding NtrC family response regulator
VTRTRRGFPVNGFATAEAALVWLEERALDTEAIFTDVGLAGNLDGIALAIAVRTRWPAVSVLVASGNEAVEERLPEGIAFLLKPWRIAEMIHRLELHERA